MIHIPPLLKQHAAAIEMLCRQFSVQRLDIFGSVTTDKFDPIHSDVDFLVEFKPDADLGPWMKRYFALRDALASVLQCEVDLVLADSVQNPYLARAIEQSRQLVYASEVPEVA